MTRRGEGGKGDEAAAKVMGPLFPRLHVSDAGKGGGPRAPPRNKMALYEQFTVPSSRFTSPMSASGVGGGLAPSKSASQVYEYERPMFQPFNVPSNVPAHSSKKSNGNSVIRQISSTRSESGKPSSQTNNNGVYAAGSAVECSSQHRGKNITKNSPGKKLATDDGFMVPSVDAPRYPQHATQGYAEVQEKLNTLCATNPQRDPPAKCYSAVNKHLERINVLDMRSADVRSPKTENEPSQALKTVEAEEMTLIQVSKEKFDSKIAKVCLVMDKANNINSSSKAHVGNTGRQAAIMNGSSTKTQNPTTSKDTVSCNPCTDLDITNRNSYLPKQSLKEVGTKRKRSHGNNYAKQNDGLSDSVESIQEWEISPDQIVSAIGQKHFWKARRAIQNQQRIFAVQVFELHKLMKVQKSIAASPHVLIEGDPCLGNALVGKKKKLPDGNLKAQTLQITNKDAIHPSPDQPDFSKENSEGNLPSLSHDDGLDGNHHGQITTNQAFTSNPTVTPMPTPATSGNKQNNWRVNPPQNQWLVPVMSPSEGLVYKPYTGPCPPAGSLLTPFYANVTPLSLPSTPYGVHMPHQQQYMAPPGTPAMPMNYFPPFTLPVMNPATPASAVEQGSQAAASQPNGNVLSRISCNMSNLSGIWKFYASRDSEPQASSASSPSDRLRGDGNGPVSFFAAASVQHAQPQPSSGSRDKQGNVIKVVPHNAQTASESAARIFQSIQMERQQSDL